jgi:uncharacterized protein YegP (UPF0339 family)
MTDEPRPDRVQVFRRADGLYDWRAVAPNGEKLYGSLQGYTHRADAIEGAQRANPGAVVEQVEEP